MQAFKKNIILLTFAYSVIFTPLLSYSAGKASTAPEEVIIKEEPETNPAPEVVSQQPAQMTEEQAKQKFVDLKKEIDGGTQNMDTYFEYAQIATAIGENKEAVKAYNYMLAQDTQLHRIKLELALVYARMEEFKDSKQLFDSVLATNPPEAVKKNIETVMVVVNNGLKKNVFSGSVSTGYNLDSNANSAASSGQATFVDTSIPLSVGSTASRDGHFYASTSLSHLYKFDLDSDLYRLTYETTGTLYKTYQDTENILDLGLASLKTGPAIEIPDIKTKFGLNGTESIIDLNGNRYLKTRSWESNFNYAMRNNLLINGAYSYEYRKFINTPTATTYTDRSGNANQQTLGVTYALTPIDILNATAIWRYESAASDIYGNTQVGLIGSYTRQLPWDLTFNTLLGFRKTNYHQPDPIVSAAMLRHDRERSMTYTLAKKMPHNITATTSYQYKNVTSNIQNNDYDNNRYSVGLGWAF